MKKTRKSKVLSVILALMMPITGTANAIENESISTLSPQDAALYAEFNQDEALDAYRKLSTFLGINEIKEKYVFPDEYAGCYVNDNNEFVLCLTDTSSEVLKKYRKICGNTILFQSSKYSMNDFGELLEVIDKYDSLESIRGGLSSQHNRLDIYVNSVADKLKLNNYLQNCHIDVGSSDMDISEKTRNAIIDGGMINYIVREQKTVVKESATANTTETNIVSNNTLLTSTTSTAMRPGAPINNGELDGGDLAFTFGVWATRTVNGQSQLGFITCAHSFYYAPQYEVFAPAFTTVYAGSSSDIELGTTCESDTNIRGNYDYAFVTRTNSTYQPTTTKSNGGTLNLVYNDAPTALENVQMYVLGSKTHMSYGRNIYSGYPGASSFLSFGYTIDLSSGYGGTQQGDSGGPVYIIQNGKCVLVGIVSIGMDERLETDSITNETIVYYDTVVASVIGFALDDLDAEIYTG